MKTLHIKTSKLCERLFKLERQGRYEDALAEIGDIWHDKTGLPDVEGLKPHLAAELILRCGSLFGFLGHNKQIPNSQDKSRDLLTHARNRFMELYDVEKIAECENHLAVAYWRTGEINEAMSWLDESFSHNLPNNSDARIYAHVLKSLFYLTAEKFNEIINEHWNLTDNVFKYGDNFLKGCFCTNVAIAFEKTENTSKALEYLEKALSFHLQSRHKIYLGTVQNNISQIYKLEKNFPESHKFIDNAIDIFKKIKDRTREGFSLDTKANIYYAEGKFDEALKTIEKAVNILKVGENAAYLVETYGTKIKTLISLDEVSAATFCLLDAVQIAKTRINEETANNLVREYENCLREHLAGAKNNSSEIKKPEKSDSDEKDKSGESSVGDIELILPSPLANFKNIHGVWIKNSHLEKFGLVKNSLAIFVPNAEIKRGDLVAVEEIKTQDVSCGLYENEFGIVCLEGQEGESKIFDEAEIKILGKIVGVGLERTKDGKLIVEPIFM